MFSMNTRPITLMTPTDRAVARAREIAAVAGHAGGIVGRPQQPRLGADVVERFLLVPDVIARRHHVDAPVEQLVADLARDAEAGGRVLGVGDDEIDAVVVDERRAARAGRARGPGRPTMSPMKSRRIMTVARRSRRSIGIAMRLAAPLGDLRQR